MGRRGVAGKRRGTVVGLPRRPIAIQPVGRCRATVPPQATPSRAPRQPRISRLATQSLAPLAPARSRSCPPARRAPMLHAPIRTEMWPPLMSDERFRVRLEGTRPIRLTVAEMTPEDVRLAVAFAERELQLMQETAAPAMALLQRAATSRCHGGNCAGRGRRWRRWCGCSSRRTGYARRCGQWCPRRRTEAWPVSAGVERGAVLLRFRAVVVPPSTAAKPGKRAVTR
jgi:hypothetical protein